MKAAGWTAFGAYLTLWRTAGAAVIVGSVWLSWARFGSGTIELDLVVLVGVLVIAALFEGLSLAAPVRRNLMGFSAMEAAVVLAVLLLPTVAVPAVVAVGGAIGQGIRGIPVAKVSFNMGVLAVSGAAAAVVASLLTGDELPDVTTTVGVVTLVAAGLAFGACNVALMAGLLRMLRPDDPPDPLRSWAVQAGAGLVISVALGVLIAAVLQVSPLAVPVLVVAGWLVYRAFAYGVARAKHETSERSRLERTVAGAADGICLIDRSGSVELLNPAARSLLNLTGATAVGQRLDELMHRLHPPAGPTFAQALRAISPEEPGHVFDLPLGPQVLQVEIAGLFEERIPRTGERRLLATGAVVLLRDVTDERLTGSLQREFVARVSHELRTPLTAIIGSAQVLKARLDLLEAGHRRGLIDMIDRQGLRLQQLVDDLLESARLQATTITPTPERVDLSELSCLIVDTLRHTYPSSEVHRDITTDVYADRAHVERIVTNLLSNAIKYGQPPIELRAWRDTDRAVIEVSDGGDGVDDDFAPRLFTPFTQASVGDQREASGLGLGLAIVASLVEANGGTIDYLRIEHRTRFRVTLMNGDPAAQTAIHASPTTTPGTPTAPGR